eukprot:GHVQ01025376.1.p1 GENE.GHVQ01025376.1~~GHVQ01025376.1.p1  ORF type:complete len:608 (+),score=66.30 GHVQ01025376.1:195-2018(+)
MIFWASTSMIALCFVVLPITFNLVEVFVHCHGARQAQLPWASVNSAELLAAQATAGRHCQSFEPESSRCHVEKHWPSLIGRSVFTRTLFVSPYTALTKLRHHDHSKSPHPIVPTSSPGSGALWTAGKRSSRLLLRFSDANSNSTQIAGSNCRKSRNHQASLTTRSNTPRLFASRSSSLLPRIISSSAPSGGVSSPNSNPVGMGSDSEIPNKWLDTPLPVHPSLLRGQLPNGLRYVILPHGHPAGRFEAYLEIFAGSADELDHQQGMAHMCEHICYMGSSKRDAILRKSVHTNAYTDFHHTVFYASCPTVEEAVSAQTIDMLPRSLDALYDVLESPTQFHKDRLDKERAAVLSEASMVNTVEYRHECQTLSLLHRENRLCKRFPIGVLELLKKWSVEDVRCFHRTHYRPDNAIIYVVGDVSPLDAELSISNKFGKMERKLDLSNAAAYKQLYKHTQKTRSIYFPPVIHDWQQTREQPTSSTTSEDASESTHRSGQIRSSSNLLVWRHSLLKSFSLCFLLKRPIKPLQTLNDYKRLTLKKIVMQGLSARLNIYARGEGAYNFVEMSDGDSTREACRVTALDIQAAPNKWRDATILALKTVRSILCMLVP